MITAAANMDINVIQNSERPLGDLIRDGLDGSDQFRAASAFLNSGGLGYVLPGMRRILEDEGSVSVVHGADFRITDPHAIDSLVRLNEKHVRMSYKIHFGWDLMQSQRFHPKLYMWTADYNAFTVVVGSSNLTLGGLVNNTEVNTVMQGSITEPVIAHCNLIFDSMMVNSSLIEPDYQFAEKYRVLHERAQSLPIDPEPPDEDLRRLYLELSDLVKRRDLEWLPLTQLEFVVKALQNLETSSNDPTLLADTGEHFVHLKSIYAEVEQLVRRAEKGYDWSTIENSIRGRINENIANPSEPGSYFIRAGGMSGRYRLSDAGKDLIRERSSGRTGD